MAAYLGLGASPEPANLEMHVSLSSTPNDPAAQGSKRVRRSQHSERKIPTNETNRKSPKQERLSRPGKHTVDLLPASTYEASERLSLSANMSLIPLGHPIQEPESLTHCTAYEGAVGRNNTADVTSKLEDPAATPTQSSARVGFSDLQSDVCDDYNFASLRHDSHECQQGNSIFDSDGDNSIDDDLDDNLDDSDLLTLVPEMTEMASGSSSLTCSPTMPSSLYSVDSKVLTPGSSVDTLILLDDGHLDQHHCSVKKFVSPVTSTTQLFAGTGKETREPIARSPFPSHVDDRSPIIGLTSCTLLRVCFRIGEAINQCSWASKSGKRVTVELYARILDSTRDEQHQHFTLCDLYHARPPYIKARYNAVIWKHVPLFDYDSKRLLQAGKMCRCIGTMKRDEKEWKMTILNIWEATWEDIEWTKGVVDA